MIPRGSSQWSPSSGSGLAPATTYTQVLFVAPLEVVRVVLVFPWCPGPQVALGRHYLAHGLPVHSRCDGGDITDRVQYRSSISPPTSTFTHLDALLPPPLDS